MICKLGAMDSNFCKVIDEGIFNYSARFYAIQIKGFCMRYKHQRFEDFPIYCMAKSAVVLPPFNPEEICQSLSGHNFNTSKCIKSKFWENI